MEDLHACVFFFHDSFLHVSKEKILEKYRVDRMQLQDMYQCEDLDDDLQVCMNENAVDVDDNFKDIITCKESDICSSCSSLHDALESIDGLSNNEATRFFNE